MNVCEIRKQIDEIDDKILDLFLKRMECSKLIGQTKKFKGVAIYDEEREKEILKRLCSKSKDNERSIRVLFSTIIDLSRKCQEDLHG